MKLITPTNVPVWSSAAAVEYGAACVQQDSGLAEP